MNEEKGVIVIKLKDSFITHETEGEHITVATGMAAFNGLIRSNGTAGFIIEALKTAAGGGTTEEEIVDKMLAKYDAPREVIAADVAQIISKLRKIGALDE